MWYKVVLLVLILAGCSVELEVAGMEKIDALLDGGITVHIDGIPDGGVPVRFVTIAPAVRGGEDDDAGK